MKKKPSTEELKALCQSLRDEGANAGEIIAAINIVTEGVTMAKVIGEFNRRYDDGEIDGFPDSSIEVLSEFYGKRMNNMKPKTIRDKVIYLQSTITDEVNYEAVDEAVEMFMMS